MCTRLDMLYDRSQRERTALNGYCTPTAFFGWLFALVYGPFAFAVWGHVFGWVPTSVFTYLLLSVLLIRWLSHGGWPTDASPEARFFLTPIVNLFLLPWILLAALLPARSRVGLALDWLLR